MCRDPSAAVFNELGESLENVLDFYLKEGGFALEPGGVCSSSLAWRASPRRLNASYMRFSDSCLLFVISSFRLSAASPAGCFF